MSTVWQSEKADGFLDRLRDTSHARRWCREFIVNAAPSSILEVGVGGLNERISLDEFLKANPRTVYIGSDFTEQFVRSARLKFPEDKWYQNDITQATPTQAEIVYSQHVLEHCSGLCPALKNMLEGARTTLLNIFFLPLANEDKVDSWQYPLYCNTYSKEHVERVCHYHGFDVEFKEFYNRDLHDGDPQRETVLIARRR